MINNENVYVCVVFHHSEIRKQGKDVIKEFCDSWRENKFPYKLVILDNASEFDYTDYLMDIEHHMIRVDDESISGITGAWNTLCEYAYANGADIITGFSDDVIFDKSFTKFIDSINDNNIVYAPLTNGIVGGPWQFQKSNKAKPGYKHTSNVLNGFWMGFTRKFYEDKNQKGKLFISGLKSGGITMDKWAGQEAMFYYWNSKYNTKCITIGDCWLEHTKLRSWKEARKRYL